MDSDETRFRRCREEAERVVKRFKKADLVGYIARHAAEAEKRREESSESYSEMKEKLDAAEEKLRRLTYLDEAVRVVSKRILLGDGPRREGARQLLLKFDPDEPLSLAEDATVEDVVAEICDKASSIVDHLTEVEGEHEELVDRMTEALADAGVDWDKAQWRY